MARIVIISILVLYYSCRDKAGEKVIIRLKDNIAEIAMPRIHEDDTLFSWTDKSDHHCGYLNKYRLQKKTEPIVKESGFVSHDWPSADFFLTVEHSTYAECDTAFGVYKEIPSLESAHLGWSHNIDSSRTADGRKIYIFNYLMERPDSFMVSDAIFEINKRVIHMKFQSRVNTRRELDSIVDHLINNITIH